MIALIAIIDAVKGEGRDKQVPSHLHAFRSILVFRDVVPDPLPRSPVSALRTVPRDRPSYSHRDLEVKQNGQRWLDCNRTRSRNAVDWFHSLVW